MNASEFRALCMALGFMAVASKDGGTVNSNGNAARAKALALLAEEFCRTSAPDIFVASNQDNQEEAGQGTTPALWSCALQGDHMTLEVQDTKGRKSVIAELRAKEGADQAAVASAIVTALNKEARKDTIIAELTACLEMCLAGENLTWDAEHDSDVVLKRIKRPKK